MRRLALALVILGGCKDPAPGSLYGSCQSWEDCDPLVAEACALPEAPSEGWCTVLCDEDKDCPASLDGAPAVCIQAWGAMVCKVPSGSLESGANRPSLVRPAEI